MSRRLPRLASPTRMWLRIGRARPEPNPPASVCRSARPGEPTTRVGSYSATRIGDRHRSVFEEERFSPPPHGSPLGLRSVSLSPCTFREVFEPALCPGRPLHQRRDRLQRLHGSRPEAPSARPGVSGPCSRPSLRSARFPSSSSRTTARIPSKTSHISRNMLTNQELMGVH